jgi:hypothetical protein
VTRAAVCPVALALVAGASENADPYTADGASVLPLARVVAGLPCSGERPSRALNPLTPGEPQQAGA